MRSHKIRFFFKALSLALKASVSKLNHQKMLVLSLCLFNPVCCELGPMKSMNLYICALFL